MWVVESWTFDKLLKLMATYKFFAESAVSLGYEKQYNFLEKWYFELNIFKVLKVILSIKKPLQDFRKYNLKNKKGVGKSLMF